PVPFRRALLSCYGRSLGVTAHPSSEDRVVKPAALRRAVDAAMSIAASLGQAVENAVVLRDSTKLALRLVPCDVLARVAHAGGLNPLEVGLAQRLADAGSPVVAPEPRVELRVYSRGGFLVSFWSYYESGTLWSNYESRPSPGGPTARYAHALERLAAGMGPRQAG